MLSKRRENISFSSSIQILELVMNGYPCENFEAHFHFSLPGSPLRPACFQVFISGDANFECSPSPWLRRRRGEQADKDRDLRELFVWLSLFRAIYFFWYHSAERAKERTRKRASQRIWIVSNKIVPNPALISHDWTPFFVLVPRGQSAVNCVRH